jgi:xylulokinase
VTGVQTCALPILRDCVEFLDVCPAEIRSLGGGSKSSLWNQIKADVTGTPIGTMDIEEASLLGAAILGGCAVGIFPNPEAACAGLCRNELFEPNKNNREVYDESYSRYKKLYSALEALF